MYSKESSSESRRHSNQRPSLRRRFSNVSFKSKTSSTWIFLKRNMTVKGSSFFRKWSRRSHSSASDESDESDIDDIDDGIFCNSLFLLMDRLGSFKDHREGKIDEISKLSKGFEGNGTGHSQ